MARYFYVWIPLVALSIVTLFIVPFLGLIVAVVFAGGAFAALWALVLKMVDAVNALGRSVLRHRSGDARVPRTAGLTVQAQPAPALQHHRP